MMWRLWPARERGGGGSSGADIGTSPLGKDGDEPSPGARHFLAMATSVEDNP